MNRVDCSNTPSSGLPAQLSSQCMVVIHWVLILKHGVNVNWWMRLFDPQQWWRGYSSPCPPLSNIGTGWPVGRALYKHNSANSLTSVGEVSTYWACSSAQYVEKNSFSSKTSSRYHHQVFLNSVLMMMILHRKATRKIECLLLKLLWEKVTEAAAFSVATKLCRTIYM